MIQLGKITQQGKYYSDATVQNKRLQRQRLKRQGSLRRR